MHACMCLILMHVCALYSCMYVPYNHACMCIIIMHVCALYSCMHVPYNHACMCLIRIHVCALCVPSKGHFSPLPSTLTNECIFHSTAYTCMYTCMCFVFVCFQDSHHNVQKRREPPNGNHTFVAFVIHADTCLRVYDTHTCTYSMVMKRATHAFTHTFIHSFIHSYTHSFIHSYTHSLIPSFIHSYIHSFIHSLIHTFIHSFTDSLIHAFIHAFIHSFIHPSIHSSTHSLPHCFNLLVGKRRELFFKRREHFLHSLCGLGHTHLRMCLSEYIYSYVCVCAGSLVRTCV